MLALLKARFVDAVPGDRWWRLLHRLADAAYPDFLRVVEILLADSGAVMPLHEIRAYVMEGRASELVALLEHQLAVKADVSLRAAFLDHLTPLALVAAEATTVPGVSVVFDRADPYQLLAIERFVGDRITEIGATTRQAVRGVVENAFLRGDGINAQVQEIRRLVGLTSRQAAAVARYREALFEGGVSPARVETLVDRQVQRQLRLRATNIARTETIRAANAGQHLLWQQLAQDGLLPGGFRRYWTVTPDDRTCTICLAVPGLNPEGLVLDELFQTPVGPILHPPAHPSCRCAVSLRRPEEG